MRALTAEVVVAVTHSSLGDLEFLHLDGRNVEQLTDAMIECTNLVSLSLSRNQLRAPLGPLVRCSALWHIDLSFNRLESLEGLHHFVALGSLKLAYNRIPVHELRWIQDVEIIHLTLEGNPATVDILEKVARAGRSDGGDGCKGEGVVYASYRPAALAVVPTPWTLDGQFVVAAERVAAFGLAAAVTAALDRSARSFAENMGGRRSVAQTAPFEWSSGAWDVGSSSWVGELAVCHLNVLRDQPTAASPPVSLDIFRLRRLAGSLSTSTHTKGYIEEDALRFNAFVARQIYGEKPDEWPRLYLKELSLLDRDVRLDVLCALAADIAFGPVPQAVLSGSLIILAASTIGTNIAQAIAALPSYAKTALCFALRAQLQAEVDAVPGGYLFSSDSAKIQLLEAVPEVVVPPPRRFLSDAQGASGCFGHDEDLSNKGSFARHATLVLSRAPACPALTAFSQLSPSAQKIYDALRPLLRAAGFASGDLQVEGGDRARSMDNPHRPYDRPWAGTTRTAIGSDVDGKRAQGGRGNGVNGVPVHEQGPDIDERYYRVIPGFEKDYSDGENECDYSDYGLASNLLHARKPKLGERVRKATGKYIFVTGVSEDGCSFTADGAEDAQATFRRSDVVWDPRGWWTHVMALVESNRRHAWCKAQRLFPVRSSDKLNRSGVAAAAGTANVAVPAMAASYAASAEELEQSAPGQPQTKARIVDTFIANKAWDATFVVAPPSAVALQNMVAQAAERRRVLGAPMVGAWSTLKAAPFVVGSVAPAMTNDVPYSLAPRPALAAKVVKAVQTGFEEAKPQKWSGWGPVDEEMSSLHGKEPNGFAAALKSLSSSPSLPKEPPEERVELEYSEDSAALSLVGFGALEVTAGGALGVRSSLLETGSADWETLQREMGTLCEANQGRPAQLPPLNLHTLRGELRVRRQQVEKSNLRDAARAVEAKDDQLRSEQDQNFFKLTSVAGDFDAQLQAAVESVDGGEDEGHSEVPNNYHYPASLASNSPEPPSLPLPVTDQLRFSRNLQRSASHGSSDGGSLRMRLLLQAEVKREKASRMFPGKVRVRPWRTLASKHMFRVAEYTALSPQQSFECFSLIQPPSLRQKIGRISSTTEVGARPEGSASTTGQKIPTSAGESEEMHRCSGGASGACGRAEHRARNVSVDSALSAAASDDPTEPSGPRLCRDIFVPGMTMNVRAGGGNKVRRHRRPRERHPQELSIQRAATSDAAAAGGTRVGPPFNAADKTWKLDLGGQQQRQGEVTAVADIGWSPAMRPSRSSPTSLMMRSKPSFTSLYPNSIAGYRGFDVSPPPSSGVADSKDGPNIPVITEAKSSSIDHLAAAESKKFILAGGFARGRESNSRLSIILRSRNSGSAARRQKRGGFEPR